MDEIFENFRLAALERLSEPELAGFTKWVVSEIRGIIPKAGISRTMVFKGKELEFVDENSGRSRENAEAGLAVWLDEIIAEVKKFNL